jgi:hypothetical protein
MFPRTNIFPDTLLSLFLLYWQKYRQEIGNLFLNGGLKTAAGQ